MELDVIELVVDVVLTRLEYEEHVCMGKGVVMRCEVVGDSVLVEAAYWKPVLFHVFHVRRCYRTTFKFGE